MGESLAFDGELLAECGRVAPGSFSEAARRGEVGQHHGAAQLRGEVGQHRGAAQMRGEAPSSKLEREALIEAASRGHIEALSKAVAEVLTCFELGEVACAEEPAAREILTTTRDVTVVANLSGGLHAAIVFGFESTVARAFAARIAVFMFGEEVEAPIEDESELVRVALGEMASFTAIATLNSLGLPLEFTPPWFVEGKGVKVSATPRAARGLSVTTDLGGFDVAFAPGASLCQGAAPCEGAGPHEGAAGSGACRRGVVVAEETRHADYAELLEDIERIL